jgi:hypothetical protein
VPQGQLSFSNTTSGGSGDGMTYSTPGQNVLNGYYRSGGTGYARYFDMVAFGEPDGTNGGGIIRFLTNPITNASTPIERMRIKSTGIIQMNNYGAGAATFDASGNISSVSDEKLKNIQGKFTTGLSAILKVNPILYKWNKKSGMEMDSTYAGFSAQNVQSAIGKYGVGINKEGYLSLQDRAIMATLVNAVKEQQKEIQELKARITALEKK